MKVLVTGHRGFIGRYVFADWRRELGYEVHGILRRHSVAENQDVRIRDLDVITHYGDLTDEL